MKDRNRIALAVLILLALAAAFLAGRAWERISRACGACLHERHGDRICLQYDGPGLCACTVGTVFEKQR